MAYIEERKSGWLVVWRDATTSNKTSRLVGWGGSEDTAGGVVTKQQARDEAEALAERKRQTERAFRRVDQDLLAVAHYEDLHVVA